MDVKMRTFWFIFTVLFKFQRIYAQSLFGCPTGWEIFNSRCYKFERDNKLILEEADSACWVNGTTLLRIDTLQEHQFISKWLIKHDLLRPSVWFTSGEYIDNSVEWDGIPVQDQDYHNLWVDGHPPRRSIDTMDNINKRMAYVIGGYNYAGFGWKVVSPSIPSAYICEVDIKDTRNWGIQERGIDYGLGIVNKNDIKVGPTFDKSPVNIMVFGKPADVKIECFARSKPYPNFEWIRNRNQPLTSLTDNRYTVSGGRFTIQSPSKNKDNGDYQCIAENEFGKALSDPALLRFGYLHSFSPVRPDDVSVNKFDGTRISCQAPAYSPDVKYGWFFESTNNFIFEGHQTIFVSSSGYLYFSEVQPTDNRKYYCIVTLTTSSLYKAASSQPPSKISLGVNLTLTGNEQGKFAPVIYTHTFPTPAVRGSQIRMECVAYGSSLLYYSWSRLDGQRFEPGTELSDRNRVLTIPNVQIEAEGIYQCHVKNNYGHVTKNITLSIEARPYFMFGIGNKMVDSGQSVQWRCKAVGRPQPTYTWYKNGKVLQNIPGHLEIHKNILTLTNIEGANDEGIYQCEAANIHGKRFSTGQLKVLSIAPNFDRHPLPPSTMIPNGGNYSIPCSVEGAPKPNVIWMKNRSPMGLIPGELSGRVSVSLENTLIFTNIDGSDNGLYTCQASNTNGESSNSTNVQVITGITLSKMPTYTDVNVNKTAFMFCQAHFSRNFDINYSWKFNGRVLDFEMTPHFVQSKKDGLDGLYIRDAQFSHTGIFTCEARTTLHTVSSSAPLLVRGPPSAVAGVYVKDGSKTNYSVELIWTVNDKMNHGSPITAYDIEAEVVQFYPGIWKNVEKDVFEAQTKMSGQTAGLREDQRLAKVDGLNPNLSYRFRVIAKNGYGVSNEASKPSDIVHTVSTAPVVAPRNIRGVDDARVGLLTMVWDPLDISERSGDGVGYLVYFKKKDDPKDWTKVNVTGAETSSYSHLVGIDNYYLPYLVKVGAYNIKGSGPNSTETIVMSAEGMPIATVLMGDCDNYNGTAFSMSWTPVEDRREVMRGRLKGYRVRYWHIDFPELVTFRDLYGQQDSTVIIGLEDNTNYWASVQVMNNAGVGPVGEERLAETFHLPPQQYPRHVTVYKHTQHSVRVTWRGVSTGFDEETLGGYILRVWKIQEDIRTATDTVVDKVMEAYIDNLQMQTVYVLRVLGFSIGGEGALSPHVYFTVQGGQLPFDPVTTQVCYDMAERDPCGSGSTLHMSLLTVIFIYFLSLLSL